MLETITGKCLPCCLLTTNLITKLNFVCILTAGTLQPQAVDYLRHLLRHERHTGYTSFGFGLPPGTIIRSKIGNAYDTVEEIAHIWLPNRREFILTAFSNGYEPTLPDPYDVRSVAHKREIEFVRNGL